MTEEEAEEEAKSTSSQGFIFGVVALSALVVAGFLFALGEEQEVGGKRELSDPEAIAYLPELLAMIEAEPTLQNGVLPHRAWEWWESDQAFLHVLTSRLNTAEPRHLIFLTLLYEDVDDPAEKEELKAVLQDAISQPLVFRKDLDWLEAGLDLLPNEGQIADAETNALVRAVESAIVDMQTASALADAQAKATDEFDKALLSAIQDTGAHDIRLTVAGPKTVANPAPGEEGEYRSTDFAYVDQVMERRVLKTLSGTLHHMGLPGDWARQDLELTGEPLQLRVTFTCELNGMEYSRAGNEYSSGLDLTATWTLSHGDRELHRSPTVEFGTPESFEYIYTDYMGAGFDADSLTSRILAYAVNQLVISLFSDP